MVALRPPLQRLVLAIATAAASPAFHPLFAQETQQPQEIQRPKYLMLAQNEDWSVLRDVDRTSSGDVFDPIKFVPLNSDGSFWASFGGHARARVESWRSFNFGAAPPGVETDDTFLLFRMLLHGDFHFGEHFRVYAEGKTAVLSDRELPGGKRPIDEDQLDLQQAFADFTVGSREDTRFTLRPGRMMLEFGKERLVSPLPWGNTLRSWDGVAGIVEHGSWNLTGFWTRFVPVDQDEFNTPDQSNAFFGLYAARKAEGSRPGYDLYWLGLQNDEAAFNGTEGEEDRHTLGGRVAGKLGDSSLDYDVEAAYQLGEVGEGDISAWMAGAQLGYTFRDSSVKPRVWVGLDYGSGDGEAGGDVGTFNQLFPLGHAYFGFIDTIGRQNILDASAGVSVAATEKLTLGLWNHAFWADDTSDSLYNAGGGVLRPGGSYESREVGYEVDLTANYRFDRHLVGLLGYSHFFPGSAIEESGPSEDIDFLYLSLQYSF